jgi:hypothetical protein
MAIVVKRPSASVMKPRGDVLNLTQVNPQPHAQSWASALLPLVVRGLRRSEKIGAKPNLKIKIKFIEV